MTNQAPGFSPMPVKVHNSDALQSLMSMIERLNLKNNKHPLSVEIVSGPEDLEEDELRYVEVSCTSVGKMRHFIEEYEAFRHTGSAELNRLAGVPLSTDAIAVAHPSELSASEPESTAQAIGPIEPVPVEVQTPVAPSGGGMARPVSAPATRSRNQELQGNLNPNDNLF